jgi:hypothetical protein
MLCSPVRISSAGRLPWTLGFVMHPIAQRTLEVLESAFRRLERQLPPPRYIEIDGQPALRYAEQLIEQALIQKLARYISSLEAAQLLLDRGFLQEQGVLHRTLDELHEDILFLTVAITNDQVTELHRRYLAAFWAEEFGGADPVESRNDREMVPRNKMRAYVARVLQATSNPSRDLAVSKTIAKVYSGFVHAASPHLMEMCDGDPPRFNLRGMRSAARFADHEFDIWNYYYRGILSATFVGKALGDQPLVTGLFEHSLQFQEGCGRDFGARRPEA